MDRNLDIDNFELLLRERSDEFKMYPTKRIWHSIYNNIHPGRKWPSIAMSITLIAILLLFGYLNTNNKTLKQEAVYPVYFALNTSINNNFLVFTHPFFEFVSFDKFQQKHLQTFADNSTLNELAKNSENNAEETSKLLFAQNIRPIKNSVQKTNLNKITAKTIAETNFNLIANEAVFKYSPAIQGGIKNELLISVKVKLPVLYNLENKNTLVENNAIFSAEKTIAQISTENNRLANSSDFNDANTIFEKTEVIANKNTLPGNNPLTTSKAESSLTNEEKDWIENYALYNRAAPKKWAGKLAWQTYITPSVVYRDLKNTISTEGDINKSVIQHPSFGLEIGGGILYPIFKGVKLKTGLQLNFTRYNTEAYGNSHPVATTIMLHSVTGQLFPAYRSTPYSNGDGITPIKLHNQTFQISIPMGVDVKIAGNENLQWNIGATIQPSYIIAGKSYLISSDKRNYIKESTMLNRFNLNAGFETFISYKTNNGFIFQMGPQFRKQLFTTNSKQYIIEERLNNYGFKFGISKLIK